MAEPLRVQFVHGLESGPGASKARYLAERFDVETPAMDTASFEGSVATQLDALAARPPDLLVGSSFGGAVVLALVQRGAYRGPILLLAPAHRHFGVRAELPLGVHAVVVHGLADDVVDPEGSRELAAHAPGRVELLLVDDGHRLASLLEGERLADLVRRAVCWRPPP